MHIFYGVLLSTTSIMLFLIAVVLTPLLGDLGISKLARWAFALMICSLGIYLFWVASFFFDDRLNHQNYSPELLLIRSATFISTAFFLGAALRCRKTLLSRRRRSSP